MTTDTSLTIEQPDDRRCFIGCHNVHVDVFAHDNGLILTLVRNGTNVREICADFISKRRPLASTARSAKGGKHQREKTLPFTPDIIRTLEKALAEIDIGNPDTAWHLLDDALTQIKTGQDP